MAPLINTSQKAEKYNDAYFTSESDAKWALSELSKIYDLKGKRVLEPAAGSGVFPTTAKKLKMKWTTNDLYPEFSQGFDSDFNLDFAQDDITALGTFDFVISNPPFGKGSRLAKSFVLKSLEISPVVAMVLPKGIRGAGFVDKALPKNVKIVLDLDLPDSVFLLPDGTTRKVGCAFIVYEKVEGYERDLIVTADEPIGYQFEEGRHDWPDWATHATCMWGSLSGQIHTRETRPKCWRCTGFFKLTDEQRAKIPDNILFNTAQHQAVATPGLGKRHVLTLINSCLN